MMTTLSRSSAAMRASSAATATTTTTTTGPGGTWSTSQVTTVGPGGSSSAPMATSPQTAGVQPPIVTNSENGLGPADRATVGGVLSSLQPLSAARQGELDNFLASDGQSVFPTGGRALPSAAVRSGVTRSGAYPGSGGDDPGFTYFVTSWGTLNVYDDRAEFTPQDNSSPPIKTSLANANSAGSNVGVPGFVPLSKAQTQSMAKQMQTQFGVALDAGQTAALDRLLQSPQQQLVPVMFAGFPIQSTTRQSDGSVTIQFNGGGSATLGPNGGSVTTTNSVPFAAPVFNFSPWLSAIMLVDALFTLALAVLLMVGAILLLRDSPLGARLHRIYAWIKIPLVIAGGVVTAVVSLAFANGMMSAVPGAGPTNAVRGLYIGWSMIMTLIALIYPVALLIALRSKRVREYYNTVG